MSGDAQYQLDDTTKAAIGAQFADRTMRNLQGGSPVECELTFARHSDPQCGVVRAAVRGLTAIYRSLLAESGRSCLDSHALHRVVGWRVPWQEKALHSRGEGMHGVEGEA